MSEAYKKWQAELEEKARQHEAPEPVPIDPDPFRQVGGHKHKQEQRNGTRKEV